MMTAELRLPEPPRPSHRLLAGSITLLAIAITILGASVIIAIRQPHPWNPLGDYPDQTVTSRVVGVVGPAVRVDGVVSSIGTKCADIKVRVRGSLFWQSTVPVGTFVAYGSGVSVRGKGCVTNRFTNEIPPEVRAAASRPDNPIVRWVITGTETPVRDSDTATREGIPRAWTTEEFEVVP